ncbi:ERC protein 2 [Salmo trutta]|uniref:ERC protein 2 n=1 Tax=Salmo trutta TaxID=8032 RepID=UPI0011303A9B|nr:ERC protein 2-like [Salmo trutta]
MYGSARAVGHIESSPARSPRLPRSPRLGHRRANSGGGGGGGGKTLSMENIQSLNAAYATSGPMYLSDHEGVGSTATYPKGTMTLGRASNRAMYGGRVTAMGSSPNIASVGLGHHADLLSYSDLGSLSMLQHHHHHPQGVPSALLRQAVRGSGGELLEMQATLRDMQRENDLLRRELDLKDSKLGSSTNSIKSFWSPELKKERMIRKEEAARTSVLKEQMRVTHEENQHLQLTIQALQDELRTQRDLNHLLQQESGGRSGDHYTNIELTEENFRRLQAEHDRQAKELFLLRKTLEEMELRIETQKQTLGARDESIKKLLEMLQSKGLPGGPGRVNEEEEQERARRIAEAEAQLGHLEVILDQKEKENIHLREELHRRNQMHQDPGKTKALQTIIEMKDTKIASLERNIRDLEDEIQILKANGLLNTEDREEEIKQMEVYKNHSKFMKTKIDQLKQELSKKESELLALQTKLETLNNQNSDCKQHIEVLKESLTAKEQRAAILQTEVDALRLRLEEKESFLNKKTKQLQDLTEEKGTLAGEIRDMKDMLEVKERKINVLQKKIENLQEQLRDKDKQLGNLKDRVKSLQTDSSNTDTALATLEEALSEKERIIERLKEQRAREDNERMDEVESYKKENKDLKEKVNTLQLELTEKESSLIDLKEHASSLASSSLKKESKLKSLEMAIEQKKEECSKLETQLQKQAEQLFSQMNNPKAHEVHEVQQQQQMAGLVSRGNPDYVEREREQRVKLLEKEVSYYKEESGKAQAEVERLLTILREVESEKNDKDKKIAELESPPHSAPVPRPGLGPVPRHGPGGRAPPDPLPPVSSAAPAAPQQIGGMVWDFLGNLRTSGRSLELCPSPAMSTLLPLLIPTPHLPACHLILPHNHPHPLYFNTSNLLLTVKPILSTLTSPLVSLPSPLPGPAVLSPLPCPAHLPAQLAVPDIHSNLFWFCPLLSFFFSVMILTFLWFLLLFSSSFPPVSCVHCCFLLSWYPSFLLFLLLFFLSSACSLAPRQAKEQVTKKGGPNLKLGPQGDKKPGQIMGDPRKDNTMDSGQHVKLEEMMNTLERTRQELDATKQRLSSTQQSLQERDGHLTNMRQERRKQLEEILEMKQQALLAAISEKDANIALLELSASGKKKTQEEVLALKREKDRLMHQLKQQTQSRMKLIADNYEDDHYHPHPPHHTQHHRGGPGPGRGPPHAGHRPSPDQDDEEGIWA